MKSPTLTNLVHSLLSRWDLFQPAHLRWLVRLLAAGWTLLIAISLYQIWHLLRQGAMSLAIETADDNLIEDLAYRRWATLHGGVYVPVTPETPPSPYLAGLPERDITTPSGRQLTLLNPEYMIRQVFEADARPFGVHGHITSLKPLRPQNAPDEWEAAALHAFDAGQKEVGSVGNIAGQPHYRLMRPLVTAADCLKCHGAQGYRVGDIRGGISTAVPLTPHRRVAHAQFISIASRHAGVWMLGLVALTAGYRQTRRYLEERQRAKAALRDSEALYQSLVSHLSQCVFRKDREGRFTFANQHFCRLLGKTLGEIKGRTDFDFYPRELAEKHRQDNQRVMHERRLVEVVEENSLPTGEKISVQVLKTPLVNAAGVVMGMQGVLWDITEHERAKQERERLIGELRESLAQVKTLTGLIPICAGCKKIRDDKNYWHQVETYISKRTDAQFTHSLCPDCIKKYYPELEET